MHEFSLAQNIAEQATEAALAAGANRIDIVRLRIGGLSGVSEEALKSCWQITSMQSILCESQLVIESVPVTLFCAHCQTIVYPIDCWILECPNCESQSDELRSGRELELVSLEYS